MQQSLFPWFCHVLERRFLRFHRLVSTTLATNVVLWELMFFRTLIIFSIESWIAVQWPMSWYTQKPVARKRAITVELFVFIVIFLYYTPELIYFCYYVPNDHLHVPVLLKNWMDFLERFVVRQSFVNASQDSICKMKVTIHRSTIVPELENGYRIQQTADQ